MYALFINRNGEKGAVVVTFFIHWISAKLKKNKDDDERARESKREQERARESKRERKTKVKLSWLPLPRR